jgi:hypothetical protein
MLSKPLNQLQLGADEVIQDIGNHFLIKVEGLNGSHFLWIVLYIFVFAVHFDRSLQETVI